MWLEYLLLRESSYCKIGGAEFSRVNEHFLKKEIVSKLIGLGSQRAFYFYEWLSQPASEGRERKQDSSKAQLLRALHCPDSYRE